MGIGNLMAMPLVLTIGRRPIFLFTLVILIAGGIWCALSKDLGSHIAGRAAMALAAGKTQVRPYVRDRRCDNSQCRSE